MHMINLIVDILNEGRKEFILGSEQSENIQMAENIEKKLRNLKRK